MLARERWERARAQPKQAMYGVSARALSRVIFPLSVHSKRLFLRCIELKPKLSLHSASIAIGTKRLSNVICWRPLKSKRVTKETVGEADKSCQERKSTNQTYRLESESQRDKSSQKIVCQLAVKR